MSRGLLPARRRQGKRVAVALSRPAASGRLRAGWGLPPGRAGARDKMAAKGPLSHVKLEGEIERCRAEGHWGQLRLLVQQQLLPPARTRRKVAAGGTEETGKVLRSAGRSRGSAGPGAERGAPCASSCAEAPRLRAPNRLSCEDPVRAEAGAAPRLSVGAPLRSEAVPRGAGTFTCSLKRSNSLVALKALLVGLQLCHSKPKNELCCQSYRILSERSLQVKRKCPKVSSNLKLVQLPPPPPLLFLSISRGYCSCVLKVVYSLTLFSCQCNARSTIKIVFLSDRC